jgi:hypothetical protein
MWDRMGLIWIQVFSPIGDGGKAGRIASQDLVNAYQVASNESLWFRNVRMTEAEDEGAWHRHDVKAEFEFTDVR